MRHYEVTLILYPTLEDKDAKGPVLHTCGWGDGCVGCDGSNRRRACQGESADL